MASADAVTSEKVNKPYPLSHKTSALVKIKDQRESYRLGFW